MTAVNAASARVDAGHSRGQPYASMPDCFSSHHLDANGIHFKKALRLKMTCCFITFDLRKAPQQKQCLIKRYHIGYVVAQQDDDNENGIVAVPLTGKLTPLCQSPESESYHHFAISLFNDYD